VTEASGPETLSSNGPTSTASFTSLLVSAAATFARCRHLTQMVYRYASDTVKNCEDRRGRSICNAKIAELPEGAWH
jgi:hypothetical protein